MKLWELIVPEGVNDAVLFVPAGVKAAVLFVPAAVSVCVCVPNAFPVKIDAVTLPVGVIEDTPPTGLLLVAVIPVVAEFKVTALETVVSPDERRLPPVAADVIKWVPVVEAVVPPWACSVKVVATAVCTCPGSVTLTAWV